MAKFDIIKDYDWTSIPRGAELRSKAPKVIVRSYKLKSNAVLNRIKNYMRIAPGGSAKDFYEKLYSEASEPEDDFYLPYFDDNLRSIGNTFDDTFQNGFGGGGGIGQTLDNLAQQYIGGLGQIDALIGDKTISNVTAAATKENTSVSEKFQGAANALMQGLGSGGSPGSYIETPKFYNYESAKEGALTVNFVLANTVNSDFKKNYDLIKKLIEINKPKRNDAISVDPPRIYRVKLYGYRYMPWAYCNSLNISMLGTKRMVDGIIMPEAYQVSFSLAPLTIEVSNFMDNVK